MENLLETFVMSVFSPVTFPAFDSPEPRDRNNTSPEIVKRTPAIKGRNPGPGLWNPPILSWNDVRDNPIPKTSQIKPPI